MLRTIVEERSKNIVIMDVFSKLAQDRIIFIDDDVTDDLANGVISQLMYLDSLNNNEITIYINSYGGSVYDGLGIIDAMRRMKSPIKTICIGKAMSMAALILMCGDNRQATELSTIMLHESSSGFYGRFSDTKVTFEESARIQKVIVDIVREHSEIPNPEIALEKDMFLTAEQSKEFKIIDEIL